MRILSTDILVVGAGLAGFTAAVRAAEKGAKVILTDKSNGPFGDGNILMASGSLRAGGKSPRTSSKELYESVMSERVGYPDLVKAWSLTCGRALDWLISSGVKVNESAAGRVWLDQAREVSLAPVYKKDVGTHVLASRKKTPEPIWRKLHKRRQRRKLIYESRPEKAHCNRPWKIKSTEKSLRDSTRMLCEIGAATSR